VAKLFSVSINFIYDKADDGCFGSVTLRSLNKLNRWLFAIVLHRMKVDVRWRGFTFKGNPSQLHPWPCNCKAATVTDV